MSVSDCFFRFLATFCSPSPGWRPIGKQWAAHSQQPSTISCSMHSTKAIVFAPSQPVPRLHLAPPDAATEAAAAKKAATGAGARGLVDGEAGEGGEDAESLQDFIDEEEEGDDVSMLEAGAKAGPKANGLAGPASLMGGAPKPPPRPVIVGPPVPKQQGAIQPGGWCLVVFGVLHNLFRSTCSLSLPRPPSRSAHVPPVSSRPTLAP